MDLGSERTKEKAERTSRKTARKGRDNRSSMGLGGECVRRPDPGFRMYAGDAGGKGGWEKKIRRAEKEGSGCGP